MNGSLYWRLLEDVGKWLRRPYYLPTVQYKLGFSADIKHYTQEAAC